MDSFPNLQRLKRIDQLVAQEQTGTPEQFARKLSISERMLYLYIRQMRLMGAPIYYCRKKCSYYYKVQGRFQIGFFTRVL